MDKDSWYCDLSLVWNTEKETKDNSCTSKVKFITSGKELQVVKR